MKLFLTAAAALGVCTARGAPQPKVLMVMMDGVRADVVENAPMTNLLRLRDGKWQPGYNGAGTLFAHTVRDARPSSAANHAAIATGATPEKTRIFKNGDTPRGNFKKWPSWLARTVEAKPDVKALFAYSWNGDTELSPHPQVRSLRLPAVGDGNWPSVPGAYEENGKILPRIMAAPDAPDAVLFFIDIADMGGHWSGFYPYGREYLHHARTVDRIIGDTLAAIASRPSFRDEDWLILVTSDHGGYGKSHGMWGGQATTIPLVAAGRNIPQGRISGSPCNCDLAPMALSHFGIDPGPLKLDGRPLQYAPPEQRRNLADALAVYLPFDETSPSNAAPGGAAIIPVLRGNAASGAEAGVFGTCLSTAAGDAPGTGVALQGTEKTVFENGTGFAFTLWTRIDVPQQPQAPVVSNKDWSNGANPGVTLVGARRTDRVDTPGVCFNCGTSGANKRIDMGTFDIPHGEWRFYAVSRRDDGVLAVYQSGAEGGLYWIAENAASIRTATGLPFHIGQDGTGKCKVRFRGEIDDFALWTRGLSHDEVKAVYSAGRRGIPLGEAAGLAPAGF